MHASTLTLAENGGREESIYVNEKCYELVRERNKISNLAHQKHIWFLIGGKLMNNGIDDHKNV